MVSAYCPDEHKKVEMLDPKPFVTKERRRPAIKGRCPSCGKTLFRFGDPSLIDEHEAPKVTSQHRGEAGEHYVLYRLLEKGITAGQAPRGAPDVDLLLDTPRGPLNVQVKTRTKRGGDRGWDMKAGCIDNADERLYYALVDLSGEEPSTYIVPSAVIADHLSAVVKAYDHPPRLRLCPSYGKHHIPAYEPGWLDEYEECWDYLGIP
jgi:hypothetical protein